jgi:hypothetical protein
MPVSQGKVYAVVVSVTAGLLGSLTAFAQATAVQPFQTLDRVNVYNKSNVLEMEFDNPARSFDFATLGVAPATATGFKACQVTASQALYCIDGTEVRYWAKSLEASGVGTRLFGCGDVGFDSSGADACIGVTVDLSGAIWLSGRKGAGYALVRAVPTISGNCPVGQALAGSYCAVTVGTFANRFFDLSVIDGDAGVAFKGPGGVTGAGVLALSSTDDPAEVTNNRLIFFPTPAGSSGPVVPVTIASGSATWAGLALQPGESMQSATLLQLPPLTSGGAIRNFALVATTRGRILATDTVNPAAYQVFDIVASRRGTPAGSAPVQCKLNAPQQYGIRASSKSGRVYLSDRLFCQSVALQSNGANPFLLGNVQEGGENLTFSTTAAYPPDATTLAPGVIVNLVTCGTMCTLLYDAEGRPAAWLSDVQLQSARAGMTLYQVKNLPDCRWIPQQCRELGFAATDTSLVYDSAGRGVALGDGRLGGSSANQFFLNVTPLLPREITDQYVAGQPPPKGLPAMLISPQFRAQQQNDFRFEALFGIPEAGVVFKQTFNGEFDVCRLTGGITQYGPDGAWRGCAAPGRELGCGYDYSEALKPNRRFDVTTVVSERYVSAVPGPMVVTTAPVKHVDTMANTGCYNPTKISGDRWSMYSYNLEVAPNTDAVFGKLVVSLYDDVEETRARLACTTYDAGAGNAPLSNSVCSKLRKLWLAGKAKLDACYSASIKPKSSAGSENCQAFLSQFRLFRDALDAAPIPPATQDPANRIGEMRKRSFVILHVFNERFLPSIPAEGFTNL